MAMGNPKKEIKIVTTAKKQFVYILRCRDNSLYTGYATEVERRVKEHNGELGKLGAKYTSGRRPVVLVYTEECSSRGEAQKREAAIKKLSRSQKELLIKK